MTMIALGMDRRTGKALPLQSDAHLQQSVLDILATQIGSRLMLRDYGSDNPDLVDQPMNALLRIRLFASTALAILRWEPRARLRRMALDVTAPGQAVLRLGLIRTDQPRPTRVVVSLPLTIVGLADAL